MSLINNSAYPTVTTTPSPNNPCPFLRTLVAQGLIPDQQASIDEVAQAIEQIIHLANGRATPSHAQLPLKGILATANGFSPWQVAHNINVGVRLDKLRFGPFYKKGNGSRLLDQQANFNDAEFERLKTFASPKPTPTGQTELGLSLSEIHAMLHANFERATGARRYIDRGMMEAEFPALWLVFGKTSRDKQHYLAVDDVEKLFKLLQFPDPVQQALPSTQRTNGNHA